jgi:2-(1,2-epoxy-1,2-dihydrophenyl)acetyl-CoA isomerase
MSEVRVEVGDDLVAVVEMCRGPNNFFNAAVIGEMADAYEALEAEGRCRAIVVTSEGKHFCAGAELGGGRELGAAHLYEQGIRLFACGLPVVAAVQGAAVGGGLGLALSADFRVASTESRFTANFARLGFHQGFGISVTLPRVVGHQAAAELLLTGKRIDGTAAQAIGLVDRLVETADIRAAARAFALELAASAPLAVRAVRATLRQGLVEQVRAAMAHERAEQDRLGATADFREGVRASAERREPRFTGS